MAQEYSESGEAADNDRRGQAEVPVPAHGNPEQPPQAQEDDLDLALRTLTEQYAPLAGAREPSAARREESPAQARRRQERARKRYMKLEKQDKKQEQRERRANARRHPRPAAGGRARGSRRSMVAAGVALAVLVGGGAWAVGTRLHLLSPAAGGRNDTQVITNGAVPSGSPSVSTSVSASAAASTAASLPTDPFAGTPAAQWANGAAGIVIPAAAPVGQYSAAQVRYAYETTAKLLSAAALDRKTLLGGAPTALVDLLTPVNRSELVSGLNKIGLDKYGDSTSTRAYLVTFAPGSAVLLGSVIKVHGTMSAHAATNRNGEPELDVTLNYTFVYPVAPPHDLQDWMRVVAHFDGHVPFGNWAGATTTFAPWWGMGPSVMGIRCGMPDGYVHPYYPNSTPTKVQPSGTPVDPYSSTQQITTGCEAITGT